MKENSSKRKYRRELPVFVRVGLIFAVFVIIIVVLVLTLVGQPTEYILVTRSVEQDTAFMTEADICVDRAVAQKAEEDFTAGKTVSKLEGQGFNEIKVRCLNQHGNLHFYQGFSGAHTRKKVE